MKKLSLRTKICSVIFIFLFLIIFLLSRPIYNKLEKIVNSYSQTFVQLVYDNTGLLISYNSISPSILSSLRVDEINLSDENHDVILSINKINIGYSLWSLIIGDYSKFVKDISIDGVTLDVNKLINLIQKNQDKFSQTSTINQSFDLKQFLQFIPSNSSIKNINFVYDDENIYVNYFINEIKFQNSRRKENIDFNLKSRIEALVKSQNINLSGNINLNGTIFDELENSSIVLNFTDITNGDFFISKINFLATYSSNIFEIHSVQNLFPLSVKFTYNINNDNINLDFNADGFEPLQLISTKNQEIIDYIDDVKIYLKAHLSYYGDNQIMDYTANGEFLLPEKLIPGGLTFRYSLYGDDAFIKLNNFYLFGDLGAVKGDLSYTFGTMQIEGFLGVQNLLLPNGNFINFDLYVDPIFDGFTFFSPTIQIGNKVLTAMQSNVHFLSDSIDFDFEVSDFNNSLDSNSTNNIGSVIIGGSYLNNSNYVQTNISLNSLSLKSVFEYVQNVIPKEDALSLNAFVDELDPYIFTGDVYLSSDFNSVSYNVPYVLVANTKEGNQYLFASANGNEKSFQLNRFDLILGSFAASLTGSVDTFPDTDGVFFSLDAVASSIPYHFTGSYVNSNINISGDYGTQINLRIGNKDLRGNLKFENLPLILSDISLILKTDSKFVYYYESGPEVQVDILEIEKNDASSSINPKFIIKGSGTKYGAQLSYVSFIDKYSTLTGSGDLTINLNDGIFDSAGFSLSMKNIYSEEKIIVDLFASNPDKISFEDKNFLENIYLDSQIKINHLGLSRFTNIKNDNNELTASVNLTGTILHPSIFLNINKLSLLFNKDLINISGNAILEDRVISVTNFNFNYPDFKLSDLKGNLDLQSFEGNLETFFTTQNVDKNIEIPLKLRFFDSYFADEDDFVPQIFSICLSSDKIGGELIKKNCAFEITATYTPEFISIFSSENLGLVGTYIPDTGELIGSVDTSDIMYFDFSGNLTSTKTDILFENIDINLRNLMSYFTIEEDFSVDSGSLNGEFYMKGNLDTPDFYGSVYIDNPVFSMPSVFKYLLTSDKIQLEAQGNVLTLQKALYSLNNEPKFIFDGYIALDKWNVDKIEANLETVKGVSTPINFKSPFANFNGDVNCNINILYDLINCSVKGNVFADNVNIVLKMTELAELTNMESEVNDDINIITDLNLSFGTHVSLSFDPLLRCIFVPDTKINLNIDSSTETYNIDGELKLKSGDINYLSRSFYIKEGSIKFNHDDVANPLISLMAETRDKDSDGRTVKIILSVENQYLNELSPKFYSDPLKSENEILELLGQVVIADSQNFGEVLATAGDYYLQSTLFRNMENKLRDLLNFDIFSFRTNVIQNTIKMSSSGLFNQGDISIGNFLDNSTVYIGKYLGSSLYVDAMLHMSLADGNVNDISYSKGLVFKPEFGLELDLPIANIRWNFAPDIDALIHKRYVPSTSVSLSWKFKF